MVAHPGAAGGPGRVRPFDIAQGRQLNRPRSVRVEAAEDGLPTAVWSASGGGRRCVVEAVLERWRIDDEWWRQRPVSRVYYRLALEDGRVVTVYRELRSGRWAQQAY